MTRRTLIAAGAAGILAPGFLICTKPALAAPDDADLLNEAYDLRVNEPALRVSADDMLDVLAKASAVFIGEQHDDPLTHRVERMLLERLHDRVGARLTLAMEMFERDGQPALDDYLASRIDETELGKRVKLWPNYPTDYRPLIEFAKANRIPVLASNAPQRIVRQVGKDGLTAALAALASADKPLVAAYVAAPEGDEYARRFAGVISEGHGNGKPMDAATIRRFYEAQCLRDDTMAETTARALDAGRFVYHVNGGFHSGAGLGTVQRLLWRRPLLSSPAVVKVIPYKGKVDAASEKGEADIGIFVPDTRKRD